MKKSIFITTLTLVTATVLSVSCSSDNDFDKPAAIAEKAEISKSPNPLDALNVSGVFATVTSDEHISKEEYADLIFGKNSTISRAGVSDEANARLQAKEDFLNACIQYEDSVKRSNNLDAYTLIFEKVTYNYPTVDQNNNPITLSSFMAWGQYWFFGYHNLDQNHIRLVCPYTHTLEKECATASNGGKEFVTCTFDDLFIMPDGQGFGITKNTDQPYLNHNLQAQQIYDALVAGWNLYNSKYGGNMEDDWTLKVCGCSQGAGNAIAVHKYLDTHHAADGRLYSKIWRFEYSNVCCGPYCPSATMKDYFSRGTVNYPGLLPLVVKSMRMSFAELASKYPEERFYSKKYLQNIDHWNAEITGKTKDLDALNAELYKALTGTSKSDDMNLNEILSDEVLDTNSDIYKDFMACLEKQDLTTGWTPVTPCYIYYSEKDDVVPYVNSEKLMQLFHENSKYLYSIGKNHVGSCTDWMIKKW